MFSSNFQRAAYAARSVPKDHVVAAPPLFEGVHVSAVPFVMVRVASFPDRSGGVGVESVTL